VEKEKWNFVFGIVAIAIILAATVCGGDFCRAKMEERTDMIFSCRTVDYYVRPGDTLWEITDFAMDKGYMPENRNIQANLFDLQLRNKRTNQRCIYPGDIIKIPIIPQKKSIAREVKNAAR